MAFFSFSFFWEVVNVNKGAYQGGNLESFLGGGVFEGVRLQSVLPGLLDLPCINQIGKNVARLEVRRMPWFK